MPNKTWKNWYYDQCENCGESIEIRSDKSLPIDTGSDGDEIRCNNCKARGTFSCDSETASIDWDEQTFQE